MKSKYRRELEEILILISCKVILKYEANQHTCSKLPTTFPQYVKSCLSWSTGHRGGLLNVSVTLFREPNPWGSAISGLVAGSLLTQRPCLVLLIALAGVVDEALLFQSHRSLLKYSFFVDEFPHLPVLTDSICHWPHTLSEMYVTT